MVTWVLLCTLPLLGSCGVLVNALTWPRPRQREAPAPGIRILIPARNEAARIGPTLVAALAQAPVTVLDDRSTDGTGDLARASGATVVTGEPLPDAWVGKPWAVHQLGNSSTDPVLLFLDADVVLEPGAVSAIAHELESCDVFTAVPRQTTGGWAEALVLPLLHLTYTAWLPLLLIERTADSRILAANGQMLAVRRTVWDQLGGFTSARTEVVDDMAFCGVAKRAGLRVRFADGHWLGATRMYRDLPSVIEGFSKNIHEGIGSGVGVLAVTLLYVWTFVVPYVAVAAGLLGVEGVLLPGLVGVLLNLGMRAWLAYRHEHAAWAVLAHPVAVLVLCGIALNSWRWSRRSEIVWAGRVYRARSERR